MKQREDDAVILEYKLPWQTFPIGISNELVQDDTIDRRVSRKLVFADRNGKR